MFYNVLLILDILIMIRWSFKADLIYISLITKDDKPF